MNDRRTGFKGGFTSVAAALGKALSGPEQANLLNLGRIDDQWASIVGPQLAAVCRPVKLAFRELTIAVAEAVWADSLNFHRSRFVAQVNRTMGRDLIDRVRLTIQPFPPPLEVEPPRVLREPTEEEIARADAMVAELDDSELRAQMKRVILMSVVGGRAPSSGRADEKGGDQPPSATEEPSF